MLRFAPVALGLAVLVSSVGSAGAIGSENAATVSARAFAVQVAVPGQVGGSSASVSAPPDIVAAGDSFAYPADGSVVSTGSVTSGAFASPGTGSTASANASSEISTVSIFGGDVTVATVAAKAKASASSRASASDAAGSTVIGLVIQGQALQPGPGTQFPIGDWGYVLTLQEGSASLDSPKSKGARAFVTGLQVRLTVAHYGLPAGTEVMIGYSEASAQMEIAAKKERPHKRATPTKPKSKKKAPADKKLKGPGIGPEQPGLIIRPPEDVTPRLTAGGYVFPVYGTASFGDTYGAPRYSIASGWHHGTDIFAPLGAPILAVADGTVFSVGWNRVGGYRFWLRDHEGNEFYYAHLSAFSPFAVNGRQVKAGTVIGFVGNTGDANGTPYHLHFEIHPVGRLYLGYDGSVNPQGYLTAWKRLEDVEFAQVAGWAGSVAAASSAPKPGAILLSSADISTADGLDPGSLERALEQAGQASG